MAVPRGGEGFQERGQRSLLAKKSKVAGGLVDVQQKLDVPGQSVTLGWPRVPGSAGYAPSRAQGDFHGPWENVQLSRVQEELTDARRPMAPEGTEKAAARADWPVEARFPRYECPSGRVPLKGMSRLLPTFPPA